MDLFILFFVCKFNDIYLLINEYIDTLVQKGGVPGIAGCLECENMIWEAIQKAKTNKKDKITKA